jgi:hypothetical protein
MMQIGCDRSDKRDSEQHQRQRSRSPPGGKEGGGQRREKQGEFHSSFSLLKRNAARVFKGPCQTIAIARGAVGGNNPLQIGCMKARSGGMRRQPIGVAVSEAGETKLKFSEEVRPAALRVEQNVCVSTDVRREIDHRLRSVCVWR